MPVWLGQSERRVELEKVGKDLEMWSNKVYRLVKRDI
jgi:hypothetical protein